MTTTKLDLDALVVSGILSESKKNEIIAWNTEAREWEWMSRFLQILSWFWAIVTWLWVMLLIAANWDSISDMMKTTIMIGVTMTTYFMGYWWSYKDTDYPKTGQALMLLGSMFYGASIFLLGQIYNLGWSFSEALLVWALGIIPLAYATEFVTIFLLGITLIYSYTFFQIIDNFGTSGFVIANIFLALGYLSLAIVRFHKSESYKAFGKILSWTGGASMLGWLFAYTFIDFWKYGWESWYSSRDITPTMWILFLLVGIAFVVLCIDIFRKKYIDKAWDIPFLLGLLPIILIFFYTLNESISWGNSYYNSYNSPMNIVDITRWILMNLLYLSIIVLMIWSWVRWENRSIVNIAMIFFAIYLFGKYLAFVFDSKMDGAYVFIWWGLACIVTTVLVEKIRRRLMKSMN